MKRANDIRNISNLISTFPVTAILGPRQCGKTHISKRFKYDHYFDLENPRDLGRLDNPQIALENLKGLIVIDEIQRKPDLFTLIRYLVDTIPNQKYLILGSASRDLIKQSSESLAGRIAYYYLGGFTINDIKKSRLNKLWLRGGFPRSFLSKNDDVGFVWLDNYISTFLERDIPQLGISIPANTLRRFWIMLSHYHSQIINYSELGRSFGISDVTIRKYLEILEGTFMVRVLQPWYSNISKRVVKRPKIYLKDSGIFHALMSIENKDQLFTHNKLGASWEGFAIECATRSLNKRNEELFFWRTHSGAEIDLFWKDRGKSWGMEFKFSDAPKKTQSMTIAVKDLDLSKLWVIYPGKDQYPLDKNIEVFPLENIPVNWTY
ncbi:MAG: ATP-binding protein [Candidatus Anammoxibacter sp.]